MRDKSLFQQRLDQYKEAAEPKEGSTELITIELTAQEHEFLKAALTEMMSQFKQMPFSVAEIVIPQFTSIIEKFNN